MTKNDFQKQYFILISNKRKGEMSMNVCEIVTNNILERLKEAEETGKTFYWVKPFS